MQLRTVSPVFVNEIFTFSRANTSALCDNWVLIMILKLKPNSNTFIIWNSKPQISNQLSDITAINHAIWNTICSFPTLFPSDFGYLNWTRLNLSCFSWFSPRDIRKQHRGKKKMAKNAISATLTGRSFAHAHKAERAVNLSLGRSSINIWKFSFPSFKLRNNPWNNVGTRRTKKFAWLLQLCGYTAVACTTPLSDDVTSNR